MGRRKIVLSAKDWNSVNYMCMIHCTGEEIAGVLQMDYDTLNRNCKEKHGIPISEYIKRHSAGGKMSLRRAQWKSAENGNVTMQIWLGKQWLGQSDKVEMKANVNGKLAELIDGLKEDDIYAETETSDGVVEEE